MTWQGISTFRKIKKPSQCSPKASKSGKNHQKSPFKILPDPSKSFQTLQIPKNLSKSRKISRNFPKPPPRTRRTPPNQPHPPQTHQNTCKISQIRKNHQIRQIWGQNLTPLSANFSTTFCKIGTSREPVGNQSGKSVHRPKRHKNAGFCRVLALFWSNLALFAGFLPKIDEKSAKTLQKPAFLCLLGRCTDFPDWFPTGSDFAKSGAEICRKRCQISRFLGVKKTRCVGLKPAEARPNPSQSLAFWHARQAK